jgi:hypothetical protein
MPVGIPNPKSHMYSYNRCFAELNPDLGRADVGRLRDDPFHREIPIVAVRVMQRAPRKT